MKTQEILVRIMECLRSRVKDKKGRKRKGELFVVTPVHMCVCVCVCVMLSGNFWQNFLLSTVRTEECKEIEC